MHNLLGLSLADPDDAILVSRPIYGRFELDFGNVAGLKVIYTEHNGVDAFEE
jgi:1-aminocyclopropane-1-carboxylate synthase